MSTLTLLLVAKWGLEFIPINLRSKSAHRLHDFEGDSDRLHLVEGMVDLVVQGMGYTDHFIFSQPISDRNHRCAD